MRTTSNKNKILIGASLILLLIAASVYAIILAKNTNHTRVSDFQSCVDNGYRVRESNPRTCTGPDGTAYKEKDLDTHEDNTQKKEEAGQSATNPPQVQNDQRKTILLLVYFSKNPESLDDFTFTRAVKRSSDRADMGTYAVEQLIAGPSSSESSDGLFSPLKDKLQGESNCNGKDFTLSVASRKASLTFCRAVASAGIGDDARITSTVSDTLKQFSSVDSVVILTRDGNCFGDMSGQNQCLR